MNPDLVNFLMGIASPAASAHLRVCDPCTDRLTAFETQMAHFNQATLAWSERRSNTISRDLSRHRITPRLTLGTVWSSAAAFALALAFGVTVIVQRPAATPAQASPSIAQVQAGSEAAPTALPVPQHEIASDNAMLAAIDSEITTPGPAQFGLYDSNGNSAQPQQPDSTPQVRE
jgi:hypothetical protein